MAHVCNQCSRVNPAEARFCYWDGAILAGGGGGSGPVQVGSAPFPNQFVFPNGQACRNFDQLALGCYQQWATAMNLLKQGYLASFLGGLGRLDLAGAAQEAANFPDPDRGLDQFLARLPTQALQPPVLKAEPSEINLGVVPMGTDRTLRLSLQNTGMRLCYGTVASDSKWLTLGDLPGQDNKIFQFGGEADIAVNIRGQQLRAGNKPLEGHLILESNAGNITINVRAEVPATPFPEGMFGGAVSPRQIAEKAKAQPLEAAPLFEKGVVARWYAANGWPYPVQGPTVPGIGGVQQFFEALGLAKPPKVELKTPSIQLRADGGASLQSTIEIAAAERKVVWAYATCDQPWVDVSKWKAGKNAVITVSIPRVPNKPRQTISANIQVTANGNQKYTVPLRIEVGAPSPFGDEMPFPAMPPLPGMPALPRGGPGSVPPMPSPMGGPGSTPPMPSPIGAMPMAAVPYQPGAAPMQAVPMQAVPMQAVPMAAVPYDQPFAFGDPQQAIAVGGQGGAMAPIPISMGGEGDYAAAPVRARGKSRWLHLMPLFLLGAIVLGLFLRDMIATSPSVDAADDIDATQKLAVVFDWGAVNEKPLNSLQFGVSTVLREGGASRPDKRLTFDLFGRTNSVVALLDEKREAPVGKVAVGDDWKTSPAAMPKEPKDAIRLKGTDTKTKGSEPLVTEWKFGTENVVLTQRVQIIPGEPLPVADKEGRVARQLDTVLVRYTLRNHDSRTHKVGLRVVMDTFMGGIDGTPFTLAGEKALVDTMRQLEGASVPDFIQAQENNDFDKPGAIVRIGLNLGEKIEKPDRLLLTRWPGHPDTGNLLANWNITTANMKDDSAVVLYWLSRDLEAGKEREMGFTYGLGNMTSGFIALSTGGSFEKNGKFSVVAQVKDFKEGATASITLPEGLKLVEGVEKQPVPTPFRDEKGNLRPNPITWHLLAEREGRFLITVRTSDGKEQKKQVKIGGI